MFQSNLLSVKVRLDCCWAVAEGGAQVIATVNW